MKNLNIIDILYMILAILRVLFVMVSFTRGDYFPLMYPDRTDTPEFAYSLEQSEKGLTCAMFTDYLDDVRCEIWHRNVYSR